MKTEPVRRPKLPWLVAMDSEIWVCDGQERDAGCMSLERVDQTELRRRYPRLGAAFVATWWMDAPKIVRTPE
jgi:hypothetical protein